MAQKPKEDEIRLQVPVTKLLAEEIAVLAVKLQWSQGRTASKLLELSVDKNNNEGVAQWMAARVRGYSRTKRKMGFLQIGNTSEIRLQITVTAKASREIELLAQRLNHTPVRMAALLLDFAVDDNEWMCKVLGSWFGRKVLSPLLGRKTEPYESAEIPNEESE